MTLLWRITKEIMKGVVLAIVILVLVVVVANGWVRIGSRNGVTDVSGAPRSHEVIVLGASVLRNGQPSDILADRLITALELYETEKVEKILLSGDNGSRDYDEVNVMKAFLLERGVPAEDIFLDHAGFDTYDSLYRAKHIFGITEPLIVTQEFHLPRVVFLARSLGMTPHGVIADKSTYVKIVKFTAREVFANVKAVFDILAGSKPKYLGEPVSIDGDGQVTWD